MRGENAKFKNLFAKIHPLLKIDYESWNNIPLCLTNAFQIMI